MANQTVKVLIPETHPVLRETSKQALAIVNSSNALEANQSQIEKFNDFSSALAYINHEVVVEVKLETGEIMKVNHVFRETSDLEANVDVDTKDLRNAGMLYKVLETREMLLKKATFSEISNSLKREKKRRDLNALLNYENKTELIQLLRSKAAEYRAYANSLTIKT